MQRKLITAGLAVLLVSNVRLVEAQEKNYYQTDFSKQDLAERRAKIFENIGKNAIAIVQGAKGTGDFNVFRQSNEFYYLSGIETPHAYLMLDGRNQTTTLYLAHRDADRERNEGKILSVEDADLIHGLTGIDAVRSVESLLLDLDDRVAGILNAAVNTASSPLRAISRQTLPLGQDPAAFITGQIRAALARGVSALSNALQSLVGLPVIGTVASTYQRLLSNIMSLAYSALGTLRSDGQSAQAVATRIAAAFDSIARQIR